MVYSKSMKQKSPDKFRSEYQPERKRSITLGVKLDERVQALADRERRSWSAQAAWLIESALNKERP